MILSGEEIRKQQGSGLVITPFNESQLNPNSYNVRLAPELLYYEDAMLDMKKAPTTKKLVIPPKGMLLTPHKLYLARTMEHTYTRDFVPMLEGRSSVGRLGLFIHVTAGFGDVGFDGYWTLEMYCIHPIVVYAGVEIGQIYYHTIKGAVVPYKSGKYQHNQGVQPSLLYKDFEREEDAKL